MKRTLFAVALLALVCPALPEAKGDTEVSLDFFYDNVSGGSWIEVGDYGYCWQPDVAVSNSNWRPYSDGYWAYTDVGWTWVSYEDFGWATYHYGRWVRLEDQGWVWTPGRESELEWGPAWVSWRTGGDYIGWAPLPPEVVVSSGGITGHVDVEFDIGPSYYNFVEVRYIGEPVLRERIFAPTQNVTFIQQTVNVTNITYKNKTVYNYGPNIEVVNKVSTRPIQRLRLERAQNVDPLTAARSGNLTKVEGDRLVVGAPLHVRKSEKLSPPPNVKTKVAKAKVDRGWAGADPNAQTQLKQKMKTEDPSKVPPPSGVRAAGQAAAGASPGAAAGAAGQVGASASPAASAGADTSLQTGKGKNRRGDNFQQGAGAAAGASPVVGASPGVSASPATAGAGTAGDATGLGRGQGKHNRPGDQNSAAGVASPTEATSATGAGAPNAAGAERGNRKGKHVDQFQNTPAGATVTETATPGGAGRTNVPAEGRRNGKGLEPDAGQLRGQPADVSGEQGQGRKGRHLEPQGGSAGPANAGDMQGQGGGGGIHKGEGRALGQPAGPGGEGQQGQGQGRGGKKDKAPEVSPAPTP
jgi:hypothetical protein